MDCLIKTGHLNFLRNLSFPLYCLGELVSFIWVSKFLSALVFYDFIMFPYRCSGEVVIWQDASPVLALCHCLSVCTTAINNPLVARKVCVGSSWYLCSLLFEEDRGGFDVVRMRPHFDPETLQFEVASIAKYMKWLFTIKEAFCHSFLFLKEKQSVIPKINSLTWKRKKKAGWGDLETSLYILFLFSGR